MFTYLLRPTAVNETVSGENEITAQRSRDVTASYRSETMGALSSPGCPGSQPVERAVRQEGRLEWLPWLAGQLRRSN